MPEPNSIVAQPRGLQHRRLVLCLALVTLLSVVWLIFGFHPEPYYQGKPASYWLDRADNPTEDVGPSDHAFAAMGSEATSFLVRTLGKRPSWHARKLSEFASRHPLPAWLERLFPSISHLQFRRVMAAHYLANLGPKAESALPTLWRIVESPSEDSGLKTAVRSTLFSVGEKTALLMPDLVRCLKHKNTETRMTAAWVLGNLGEKGRPGVPALAEALLDPHPSVRKAVFDALARLRASPEDFAAPLGGLLRDRQTRAETLTQLARFRSGGRQTAAALAEVFAASSISVQKQILYLLEGIAAQAGPAVPTLIAALSHNNGEIRYLAIRALGKIGPQAKAAIPVLKEQLKDENDMIKTAAASALKKFDGEHTVDPAITQ